MSHVFQEIIKVKVSSECMVKMPWNENERGKESKKGTTLQQVFTVRSFRVFRMKFAKWMQCLFVYSLTYMICVFWVHTLESQYARVCVLSVSVIYSSTLKIKSRVDSMKRITSNENTHKYISHIYYSAKDGSSPKKTGLTVFCMLSFNFMHSNYMIPFRLDSTLKNLFHFGFGWKQNKNHSDEAFDMRLYL